MFALCRPKHRGFTPMGTPGNFGPKWPTPCWFERRKHSIANCGRMLQIAQRSQWRAYRKPLSLFRTVPSLTPYDPPSPKMGFHMPSRYASGHISATGDPIQFMFGSRVGFSGSADQMTLFPVTSNPTWRQAAILDNFEWPVATSLQRLIWSTYIQCASPGHLCDSTAFLLQMTLNA